MAAFAISASSSSAQPVAFTSTTPAVCTVAAGTVSLVTAGTCSIRADQAGTSNYLVAPSVTRSFTVSPTLTITTPASGLSGYNTVPYVLTLASTGGAGSNVYAVSTGTLPNGLTLNTSTGEI
jgi:hypothetical protein